MNTYRALSSKKAKKLLSFCAIAVVLMCSIMIFPSSHAFAATRSPMHAADYSHQVYPDVKFLGCGTGWNNAIDISLFTFQYAYTTGNQMCSEADWNDSGYTANKTCDVSVYVPTIFATANIAYAFVNTHGSIMFRASVNQNATSGFVELAGNVHNLGYVFISSNNGENGTYMAAGLMVFVCS